MYVMSYYASLVATSMYYMGASFQSELPWSTCDEALTPNLTVCVDVTENATQIIQDYYDKYQENYTSISPAEQYFSYGVYKIDDASSGIGLPNPLLALCLAITYILLFFINWKQVQGIGKASYFTALFPYVTLLIILIKGLTLPGAMNGLKEFLTPDFNAFLDVNVSQKLIISLLS